jgi:hypothetical protein
MGLPAAQMPDFSEQFFIELAIGTSSFDDVCWANGYDPANVRPWETDPAFLRKLAVATSAVEDDGRAFRARCRVVVTSTLTTMQQLIEDAQLPAGARVDAFKTMAKCGELEPTASGAALAPGTGLSLTIVAPNGDRLEANIGVPAPASQERGLADAESPDPAVIEGEAEVVGLAGPAQMDIVPPGADDPLATEVGMAEVNELSWFESDLFDVAMPA